MKILETKDQYEWAMKLLDLLMDAPVNPDQISDGFYESLVFLIQGYEDKVIQESK